MSSGGTFFEMLSAAQASLLEVDECVKKLYSDKDRGLTPPKVTERRRLYGRNELTPPTQPPIWKRYLAQFKDPLIGLLLCSAFISICMAQYDDAVSISIALIIVVSVGFVQEYRSERALEKLTKLVPPKARVLRNGDEMDILASEIVSGDVVLLKAGDRVPADARIFAQSRFLVDESSMTGETQPQKKTTEKCVEGKQQSYNNMTYMGCLVLSGTGKGIVTATGEHSQFGELVRLLSQEEPPRTPLQNSMDRLGQQLSFTSFGIIGRGHD